MDLHDSTKDSYDLANAIPYHKGQRGAVLKKVTRTSLSIAFSMMPFFPSFLHAENEKMVESIMKLRADVETLYTKIDENKENYRTQMQSLAMQIADSEAQINRINTSIKLADVELQKTQMEIADRSNASVELRPLLESAFTMLETSIREGLPFMVQERLAALEKIKTDLAENLITEERAVALLWASYDDSIRLTSEIGLFKQKVTIDGQDVLANVAKIGSVMLFFQTLDSRVGYVTKDRDRYMYKTVQDPDQKKSILVLFDALRKQIRTGYFSIPNALLVTGGS